MHDREGAATQVISQERLERLLNRLTFPFYRQAIGYENDHLITLEALKDPSQEVAREPGVELWWVVEVQSRISTRPATRGVSYHRESWPNGVKGMAMPHGALFVP
jgi:hypothetical protein